MRTDPLLLHEIRLLRRAPTAAERMLWPALRGRRFMGLRFRRQALVGGHPVSFLCPERRLVIHADGGDAARNPLEQERMAILGMNVICISDADLGLGHAHVLGRIARALRAARR